MGLIALPTMLRSGYDPRIASGIVCTAGTLGQIIPPSTLLIILADVMSNAYQQAQYEQGKFSVEALSVGQFFAAAIVPGLLLVALYLIYILALGLIRPRSMPPAPSDLPKPDRAEVSPRHRAAGTADLRGARRYPWRHRHPDRGSVRRRRRSASDGRPPAGDEPPPDRDRHRRSDCARGLCRSVPGAAATQRSWPRLLPCRGGLCAFGADRRGCRGSGLAGRLARTGAARGRGLRPSP